MEPLRLPRFFLFLAITLLTTTAAGAEWITGRSFFALEDTLPWSQLYRGLPFSLSFVGILTCHEFGHYLMARHYRYLVSLPLYIPMYLGFLGVPTLGTAGAFIRIYNSLHSRTHTFDIGVAGPIAGFIAALGVLWYGFTHLPPPEYIFQIHPDYTKHGLEYARYVYKDQLVLSVGDSLLTTFFKRFICPTPERIPHPNEIMHYPYLFAGYLALLVTALNLLPIGQLDGGHTLLGLFGQKWHDRLSPLLFTIFMLYAGWGSPAPIRWSYDAQLNDKLWTNFIYLGLLTIAFSRISPSRLTIVSLILGVFTIQYAGAWLFPGTTGYQGWVVFGLLIGRFLGIYHPPVPDSRPMTPLRRWVGILTLLIFVLCFSPAPLQMTIGE